MVKRLALLLLAATAIFALGAGSGAEGSPQSTANRLGHIGHIVVIYEENHSFDNLYGGWEGVNGRANADAVNTLQIGQGGATYDCLLQDDVNLTSPTPLSGDCQDTTTATPFASHFHNAPFSIEQFIP